MWIDSHCHLTHTKIREMGSPSDLIAAANEAGVEGLLTISCQIRGDFKDQLSVARAHNGVWCSIGTHPHDSGKPEELAVSLEELVALANSDPKIIGIGESGLDYYFDYAPRKDQETSFRKHIRVCLETGLPLIVHSRDAEEDTIRIIREESAGGNLKGVMHCFSSKRILAEAALEMGFYISLSGMVTFKAADELRDIVRDLPLDRLLVETDAPFLAPMPHRGKTNQPAFVTHTGEYLAAMLGIDYMEMARVTKNNFFRLFARAHQTLRQPAT
jgi:TatD DNase family protein